MEVLACHAVASVDQTEVGKMVACKLCTALAVPFWVIFRPLAAFLAANLDSGLLMSWVTMSVWLLAAWPGLAGRGCASWRLSINLSLLRTVTSFQNFGDTSVELRWTLPRYEDCFIGLILDIKFG